MESGRIPAETSPPCEEREFPARLFDGVLQQIVQRIAVFRVFGLTAAAGGRIGGRVQGAGVPDTFRGAAGQCFRADDAAGVHVPYRVDDLIPAGVGISE
jgi:hypothetical protein